MQYLKHPLLKLIIVITLSSSSAAMAVGRCKAVFNTTETINFGTNLASKGLTIGADTPNGTVVYQDSSSSQYHKYLCERDFLWGLIPNPQRVNVQPWDRRSTFPLGETGLSFRISVPDEPTNFLSSQKLVDYSFLPRPLPGGTPRLEIVKTGELAENVKIDAGYLGSLQADDLILLKFNLVNPILLNSASCQTPSILVDMGTDYQLGEFDNIGPTQRKVRFNIALDQCMSGIKRVTYSLKATTPVINAAKGIIALSNDPLNAKDIGLQLMNDTGQPIALDTTYPFNEFNTTSTSFKIPLSAAYYRLGSGELKAGNGNTSVTFIVNYL